MVCDRRLAAGGAVVSGDGRDALSLERVDLARDGNKLEAFLGDTLPRTPLETAVRDTLVGLACLTAPGSQQAGNKNVFTKPHAGHQGDANRSVT